MKKIVLLMLALMLTITSANALSLSWVMGKFDETTKSVTTEVESNGWDFRQVAWIDPFGRVCTVIFTDDKGGLPDCDFPPKSFDYNEFYKNAK